MQVDIIGGGLAGLSAAIALKHYDSKIDVIVHEKYGTIGYNHDGRRCGEAHSIEAEWRRWVPPRDCVFNYITEAEVEVGSKKYHFTREPETSVILNRQAYIAYLGKKAEALGVHIQTHDKVSSVKNVDGEYVIDASGCPNLIKKKLKIDRGMKGPTYQQTIQRCNVFEPHMVRIYYTGKFGYYWIFPRDPNQKEMNIGIGFIGNFGYDLKQLLEDFKETLHITGEVSYVSGGLIPLGLQHPVHYKNILFVGDAGVGTFPFSGQGNYRALLSGDLAGRLIAQGIPEKYSYIVHKYFIKWDLIGKSFIYINRIFRKINSSLVLRSFNQFAALDRIIHF